MPAPEAATAKPRPAHTSHNTISATFFLIVPGASQVSLCGDFNNWAPDATPMARKANGRWETTLALRPGRYEYKFIADGRWIHDPNARENVGNYHGTLNSVLEIRA